MTLFFSRIKRLEVLVSCFCIAMLVYFVWYAFHGARGYPYRDKLVAELAVVTGAADVLIGKRRIVEDRVKLMRPESIDPDLLDELARRALFIGKTNEIIVKTQ